MVLNPENRSPTAGARGVGNFVAMICRGRASLVVPVIAILAACHPSVPATAPDRCGPTVPENAQHPVAQRAIALGGEYELIQVRSQPDAGLRTVSRLHLARPDSSSRAGAIGGSARDLIGWVETLEGDSTWHPGAGSRDPAQPGAVLAGDHLRLGQPGAVDAHVEHLTLTAVAPDGFWGWWKAEPGWEIVVDSASKRVLPDPAGYFCALRVQP